MSRKTKIGTVLAGSAATIAASYFLLTANHGQPFFVPAYSVSRVIDGDTFVTTDKQYIRIASTDAPELTRCGGPEAKAKLEKLILGKPVYLKVIFHDRYQRLVSYVYTKNGFVNETMLAEGYSFHSSGTGGDIGSFLQHTAESAKGKKKGIYGEPCTQSINLERSGCNIKGNLESKVYFTPACTIYERAEVQLYLGDVWFCTEKEAVKEGFRKPQQCS